MNALSGAEALVRLLQQHGVTHIFGLCGDTSLPFYDALYRLDHGITHILTRDERHAAYMADAYARVTHRPGICEGPSGGGATYILPGLIEANESSISILAITTDIATTSRGRFALTELDQEALFRPVTKWNTVIASAGELPRMVRRAFREMTAGRPGAVHLGLPFDVQKAPVEPEDVWADPSFAQYPAQPLAPAGDKVEALAEALLQARRPLAICGGGVVIARAETELQRLSERLAMPVATSISGQGSIAETHPLAIGVVGSNGGTAETREIVDRADLVLFIGCRAGSVTTQRWRSPTPGQAKILHIDCDPAVIGANYPTSAALLGDARLALAALNTTLDQYPASTRDQSGPSQEIVTLKKQKFEAFAALAASDETPIRPERLVATLAKLVDEDAIIVADPGTPCPYVSAYFEQRRSGRHFISNRAHGALGFALPAVVGAAIGRPSVKSVAVMGDGSFGMACGELETIARLSLPVSLIVVANAVYGWIKAGQRAGFHERYYSVDFSPSDHAAIARGFGIEAFRVEDPERLQPVLAEALDRPHPTLVDVVCQPLHESRAPVSEWVA